MISEYRVLKISWSEESSVMLECNMYTQGYKACRNFHFMYAHELIISGHRLVKYVHILLLSEIG